MQNSNRTKGQGMRIKRLGVLLLVVCGFTLGMGSMGDGQIVAVPEPEQNYKATLVDQADVSMELEKFSCAGQTYLSGSLGKSELSIDFKKIRSIFFLLDDRELHANVSLKDGRQTVIVVDKTQPCYGVSSFADVKIEMRDIKTITLYDRTY